MITPCQIYTIEKEIKSSVNAQDAVSLLLMLAGRSAAIASLAFMASGTTTKEMMKDGNPMACDSCRMLAVRGPPMKFNINMPNNN